MKPLDALARALKTRVFAYATMEDHFYFGVPCPGGVFLAPCASFEVDPT